MYRMKRRKVIEEGFADCGSNEEFEYAPWEGSGNKEGRGGDNVCFPTKPARLLPCFITLHVCRIRCAAMCV